MVLIGPTRIWFDKNSDRDQSGVVSITHDKTGHECCFDSMVFFGGVADEPPQQLADACDVVLLARRADEVTRSEADKLRNDLIGHCRTLFKRVRGVRDRAGACRRDARVLPRREERAAARCHSCRSEFGLTMRRGWNV